MSMPVEQTHGEGDHSIDDVPEDCSARVAANPFEVVTNVSGIAGNSDERAEKHTEPNIPLPTKKLSQ